MKIPAILFVFLALIATSCSPPEQDSELAVVVGPNPANVLPIAQTSCKQELEGDTTSPGLPAPSIELGVFKILWKGKNTLKISYLDLTFRHGTLANWKFTCTLGSSDLEAIALALGKEIPGVADPATAVPISAGSCGIRCGGIEFNSAVTYAYVPGTLKIVGVEYDAENVGTPVVTEVEVAFEKKF
jgi:hypothetical protein